MPDHCFVSYYRVPQVNKIDFEVPFNPNYDPIVDTDRQATIYDASELCTKNWPRDGGMPREFKYT